MKALIFAIVLAPAAHAATVETTTDAFGGCITEEALDAAFDKGGVVPRTCIPDPCAVIGVEEYHYAIVGRPVSPMEYDAFLRKQDETCPIDTPRAQFTDRELIEWAFSAPPLPLPKPPNGETPPAVPLPAGAWMLLSGLALLWARKFFGRSA